MQCTLCQSPYFEPVAAIVALIGLLVVWRFIVADVVG